MHLIITSRADPTLSLARLRVRRQLSEIRAADLRFTPDEVAAFLKEVMGVKSLSGGYCCPRNAHRRLDRWAATGRALDAGPGVI